MHRTLSVCAQALGTRTNGLVCVRSSGDNEGVLRGSAATKDAAASLCFVLVVASSRGKVTSRDAKPLVLNVL